MLASPKKTLALFGMSGKDEAVISSLLDLVADKMRETWSIDSREENPDRLLINTSDPDGLSTWHAFRNKGARRIALAEGSPPRDAQFILNKPIRAYQLIAILDNPVGESTGDREEPARDDEEDLRYRLKRWPDTQVIQSHQDATRLSAVLTRQAMSVSEVSKMTHLPVSSVSHFINTCQARGWLATELSAGRMAEPEPVIRNNNEHRGLFSKIRSRLGLGSA